MKGWKQCSYWRAKREEQRGSKKTWNENLYIKGRAGGRGNKSKRGRDVEGRSKE